MSIREDLKAYLDGELDSRRADEIRVALDRDAELRQEYEQLRLLSAEITRESSPIRSEGFERTLAALQRKRRPTVGRWILAGGLVAAIAIAVLFTRIPSLRSFGQADESDLSVASAPSSALMKKLPIDSSGYTPNGFASHSAEAAPDRRAKSLEGITPRPETLRTVTVAPTAKSSDNPTTAETGRLPSWAPKRTKERQMSLSSPKWMSNAQGGSTNGIIHLDSGITTKKEATNLASTTGRVTEAAPEQVVLSFATREAGEKSVVDFLAQHKEVSNQIIVKTAPGQLDSRSQTITVDVPEANADQLVGQLKLLASKPQPFRAISKGIAANTAAKVELQGAPITAKGGATNNGRAAGEGGVGLGSFGSGGFGGGGSGAGAPGAYRAGRSGKTVATGRQAPSTNNVKAPRFEHANVLSPNVTIRGNSNEPLKPVPVTMSGVHASASKKATRSPYVNGLDGLVTSSRTANGTRGIRPAFRRITIVIVEDKDKIKPVP